MKVYTAQYRYAGPHRLDITVKGNDPIGKVFAPSWAIVNAYKANKNEKSYTTAYHAMMFESYKTNKAVWMDILAEDHVVLVCFCPPGTFCHRTLVAGYLERMGGQYMGEIELKGNEYILPTIEPVNTPQADTSPIVSFRGEYGFLSNFYKSPIVFGGITYKSNEHLFQSRKFGEDRWAYMSKCPKPKQEGRKADISNGWFEANKQEIMLEGLRLKFINPTLKAKLLATGDRELVEGNNWHDNLWGDCNCPTCKAIPGQNMLGKLLMQVRDELS